MNVSGPTTNHDEIRTWAQRRNAVPCEILPAVLDHQPAVLRMMLPEMAGDRTDVRVLTWEEFFLKFDLLGLAFVYDDNHSDFNELLQMEERDPYGSPANRLVDVSN